jgi:hypothetical protein
MQSSVSLASGIDANNVVDAVIAQQKEKERESG